VPVIASPVCVPTVPVIRIPAISIGVGRIAVSIGVTGIAVVVAVTGIAIAVAIITGIAVPVG
jgi:hypothetical protein